MDASFRGDTDEELERGERGSGQSHDHGLIAAVGCGDLAEGGGHVFRPSGGSKRRGGEDSVGQAGGSPALIGEGAGGLVELDEDWTA